MLVWFAVVVFYVPSVLLGVVELMTSTSYQNSYYLIG